ncbi:hypothetical protein F9J28_19535 [Escherichia coli]|nr:hypothetical protein [Escherichia coli]EFE7516741.1 hypothetical protein [Escherichia coli]EFH9770760.1 hypothetical protein [Escherichia coli]
MKIRTPLRNQDKSTIGRLRSFVCIADDAPEKRVNMSSPERFCQTLQFNYLRQLCPNARTTCMQLTS